MKDKGRNEDAAANLPCTTSDTFKAEFTDGKLVVSAGKPAYDRLARAFGGIEDHAQAKLLSQIVDLLPAVQGSDYTETLTMAVELVEAMSPTNPVEGMLAVQMVAAHFIGMDSSRRTLKSDRADLRNINANIATKAQRTFIAQMEGLAKLRRNGEQVIKHFYVGTGGQAIIADTFNHGGGGREA